MDETLLFNESYKKLYEEGKYEEDKVHYSCIPFEIEYIECLRKNPIVSVSQMKKFCDILRNSIRISLEGSDIAEAIEDEDYEKNYFSSKKNPYHLAAITAILYKKNRWWDDSLYNQYLENYGEL